MTEANGADGRPMTTQELTHLVRKASQGDTQVMPALREALQAHPWFWEEYGNVAKTARDALVRCMAGEQQTGQQEMYTRKLDALTTELGGVAPSPLERLVVERIVLCWLHLHYAEAIYAQNLQGMALRHAEFHQARISKAQTRYLAAIRTLAQIRRLGVPTVQVNIAEQQVNLAG